MLEKKVICLGCAEFLTEILHFSHWFFYNETVPKLECNLNFLLDIITISFIHPISSVVRLTHRKQLVKEKSLYMVKSRGRASVPFTEYLQHVGLLLSYSPFCPQM